MNPTLAALRNAVKGCNRFHVHADRDTSVPTYSDAAIFTLSCVRTIRLKGPRVGGADYSERKEVSTKVAVKGRISHGHTSRVEYHKSIPYDSSPPYEFPKYADGYRTEHGFWSLWNDDVLRSAVLSLPSKCEPFFVVSLDGGTTENHTRHGLHGDSLYLEGRDNSGQPIRTFLLDSVCTPHNSARFGSPKHDNDQGSLQEWIERRDRETAEWRANGEKVKVIMVSKV